MITGCGEKAAPVSDTLLGEFAWVLDNEKLNEMVFKLTETHSGRSHYRHGTFCLGPHRGDRGRVVDGPIEPTARSD